LKLPTTGPIYLNNGAALWKHGPIMWWEREWPLTL
jgi:hypothetical protein